MQMRKYIQVILCGMLVGWTEPSALLHAAGGDAGRTKQLIEVLKTSTNLYSRARACQQAGEFGTGEIVPALAALLDDEKLAAYARSGLENIAEPAAAEALLSALDRLKGDRLIGVVNSIGARRDEKGVAALQKLVADSDAGVARAALLALGRIGTDGGVETVRAALRNGPAALKADAATACLFAAERLAAGGKLDAAKAIYDEIRTMELPACYRMAATRGAILARKGDGAAFLIEQLKSPDRNIRNAALRVVREIRGEALAAALTGFLDEASPEMQGLVLQAMQECNSPAALAAVRARVSHDNAEVRTAALTTLSVVGGAADVASLIQAVKEDRTPAESAIALRGLRLIGGADVDSRILKALSEAGTPALRVKFIQLLGERSATSALDELLKQAADLDMSVRVAALRAIRPMVSSGAVAVLIGLVKSSADNAARDAAEAAVEAACAKGGCDKAACEKVMGELKAATEVADKKSWVKILATVGYAPALPAITAMMKDGDKALANYAISRLGRWPDPAPIEALFGVLEAASDEVTHRYAMEAVVNLAVVAADQRQQSRDVVAAWFKRVNLAVKSLAEKRSVISGLGHLPHVEGYKMLSQYREDVEVKAEAGFAIAAVAPALAQEAGLAGEMRVLMKKWYEDDTNPGLQKRAYWVLQRLPQESAKSR